jgi:hypothetical protein
MAHFLRQMAGYAIIRPSASDCWRFNTAKALEFWRSDDLLWSSFISYNLVINNLFSLHMRRRQQKSANSWRHLPQSDRRPKVLYYENRELYFPRVTAGKGRYSSCRP